jgi:hypothetical protein
MALNYSDRDTLLPKLAPRVTEAIRKYFLYLSGGGGGASQGRIDYATNNMKNIGSLTAELLPWMTSETAFIDGGTSITDAEISSRVESVLQNPDLYLPA